MLAFNRAGTTSTNARNPRFLLQAVLVTVATVGFAGSAVAQGRVSGAAITGIAIDTHDANMAFISIDIAKADNPTCSTSAWAFVLPLTTPLQNLMFSQLVAARANHIAVTLGGSGLCETHDSVETLTYINL